MKNAIKSEFKKLLTIRSTYIILILGSAITALIAFYAMGIKGSSVASNDPLMIYTNLLQMITNTTLLTAILGVLVFTHEYRYNTISYTLTNTSNRLNVIISKILAVSVFTIIYAVVISLLFFVSIYLGNSIAGHPLIGQDLHLGQLVWKVLFGAWGSGMLGLILGGIIRNQVGALIGLIIGPGIVEGLIGTLLLKDNAIYLPFFVLNKVTSPEIMNAPEFMFQSTDLTSGQAAMIFLIYAVVGWVITLILLKKRDAN